MEIHEAANIFPLDEGTIPELAEDIRKNGLQVPIECAGGKVLDGRRRLKACELAGVEPEFRDVNPADPVAYVLSLNLHRRHLTTSQRAMIAARAQEVYMAAAKERQRQHGGTAPGRKKTLPEKSTEVFPPATGDTRDLAGKSVGVSGFSVSMARKVLGGGVPELVQAVDEGRLPVATAARIAERPHAEQRKELSGPANPVEPEDEPEADQELDEEERERLQKLRGKAVEAAHEAINCLMKIRRDNPGRARAFQMVRDWIRNNS